MIQIKYVTRALINYPWLPQVKPELLLNFQIRNILPWQSEWQWFWISSCGGILIRGKLQILNNTAILQAFRTGKAGAGQQLCPVTLCMGFAWVGECLSYVQELWCFHSWFFLSAGFLWSYNWNQKSFLEEGELCRFWKQCISMRHNSIVKWVLTFL